jgi:hypothetical protein
MQPKTFEIRDRLTFIAVLAVKLEPSNDADQYLLNRSGFGNSGGSQGSHVLLTRLNTFQSEYSPHGWDKTSRTMYAAHEYIQENFDELESGSVVDVEFILGESNSVKTSESFYGKEI